MKKQAKTPRINIAWNSDNSPATSFIKVSLKTKPAIDNIMKMAPSALLLSLLEDWAADLLIHYR